LDQKQAIENGISSILDTASGTDTDYLGQVEDAALLTSELAVNKGLRDRRFANRREAKDEVIDRLMFCNHSRLHSTRNYISPIQFEQRWLAEQRKKSA
jgi:hypothetical protein